MSEPVTLIVTATFDPDNMPAAQRYMQAAVPMLVAGGGEILRRVKVERPVVGNAAFDACLIVSFPDGAAIDGVFGSDAYAALVEDRDAGFVGMDIVLARSL